MTWQPRDVVALAWAALVAHRLRSALTMLGIVIGITSVVLLTSLGEGTRQYVLNEVTQFGTNLLQVTPGRIETTGIPGALGVTIRKLTVDDAEALRRVPGVEEVVPVAIGMARVQAGERGRSVFVYGVTSGVPAVWKFQVGQGRFLPSGDPRRASPLVVLGPKLKREIFGEANALGQHVRIGGQRMLVIGVMAPKGLLLGFDIDDSVYVPVASAQQLFNRDDLMEIDVLFASWRPADAIARDVRAVLVQRHDGREDFTITTQTGMLDVLENVLGMINLAVAGIGAISLVVGAIGILTIMWISVGERTSEIGLRKALGAKRWMIAWQFMIESAAICALGGILGVLLAYFGTFAMDKFIPTTLTVPVAIFGVVFAAVVGIFFGLYPSVKAARLSPIEALRHE